MVLNFATSSQGSVRVELQDAAGATLDGFALSDCQPLRGDEIEQTVAWRNAPDISRLAGKPIRLRLELRSADLFSFRFRQ